ncbi:UNVERIFIED_CONTAM: hypothetical protein FKN15_011793 [Acipenser sinensis]
MASETMNRVSFGSTQERKLLPHHSAPDRLGVEVPPLRERPHLGPGCYNNHTVSIQGDLRVLEQSGCQWDELRVSGCSD